MVEDGSDLVAVEFTFRVPPQSQGGGKLQVPSPDGNMLVVPLPKNARPDDQVVMSRTDDGRWVISHLTRPDSQPSRPPSQPSQPSMPSQPSQWRSQEQLREDLAAGDAVTVRLATTKGDILMRIVPKWAPRGARRFLELVDNGFFQCKIAIYRAVPDFLVQFGVVKGGPAMSAIEDDPTCGVPVQAGSVVFAAAGPDTRRHTLCIFLRSFPALGKKPSEAPIGKVADARSMETWSSVHMGYGDVPQQGGSGPDPLLIEEQGNLYIHTQFPQCDFITGASRVQDEDEEACTIA